MAELTAIVVAPLIPLPAAAAFIKDFLEELSGIAVIWRAMEYLDMDIHRAEQSVAQKKSRTAVRVFDHYIAGNTPFIPSCGGLS